MKETLRDGSERLSESLRKCDVSKVDFLFILKRVVLNNFLQGVGSLLRESEGYFTVLYGMQSTFRVTFSPRSEFPQEHYMRAKLLQQ